MAITFIANTNSPSGTGAGNSNSVNSPVPAGTQPGDVMVGYFVFNNYNPITPTGWTQWSFHAAADSGTNFSVAVYYRVATSADVPGNAVIFSTDQTPDAPDFAAVLTYRGVDTSNPISNPESSAWKEELTAARTMACPNVTVSGTQNLMLYARAVRRTYSSGTVPNLGFNAVTGCTARTKNAAISGSGHTQYGWGIFEDDTQYAAGSVTGATTTVTNDVSTITYSFEYTIGLRSAAVPATGSLAVTAPHASSSSSATVTDDGALVVAAPHATSSSSATVEVPGAFAVRAPSASASFAAKAAVSYLAAVAPSAQATLAGALMYGPLSVSAPLPQVSVDADAHHDGPLVLTAPAASMTGAGLDAEFGPLVVVAPFPSVLFGTETAPFGPRVVKVPFEDRTDRIIKEDVGGKV